MSDLSETLNVAGQWCMQVQEENRQLIMKVEKLRAENAALQPLADLGKAVEAMGDEWALSYWADFAPAVRWLVTFKDTEGDTRMHVEGATPLEALAKAAELCNVP